MSSILHLTGSFLNGGSERQAAALACEMKRSGEFDVHIATLNSSGPLSSMVSDAGFANIPEFPLTSFYDLNFATQVRRLARYLRAKQIKLVHTHDFYTNIFGLAAAELARTSILTSKRETGGMRSSAQDRIEGLAFRLSDAIVANSAAVRDSLLGRGISAKKINVVYNGLDLGAFENVKPDAARLGLPSGRRFVTVVANLRHAVKNIPLFLDAGKAVVEKFDDVDLVVAGEGELIGDLKDRAASFSDRVHFIGRCDDVPTLLASSHACCLTSDAEGFSSAIIEYMAAGRPVVATNVGGAAEAIVESETGYLVAPGDVHALTDRLVRLLSDPALANKAGAAGAKAAHARFSRAAQVEQTSKLYRQILAR